MGEGMLTGTALGNMKVYAILLEKIECLSFQVPAKR